MRKIASTLFFGASLILLAAAVFPSPGSGLTSERVFEMADGLELHAWISRPMTKEPAPLLILLPMRAHDHRSYDDLRTALVNRAVGFGKDKIVWPCVVAFDLRGHGRSKVRGDTEVHFRNMPDEEYMKMPTDVAAAIKEILADSSYLIDSENIMVVGASIGANTSIMLTKHLSGITKVVMLSPGQNYLGLEPEKALADFTGEVAIYASQEDRYSCSSAKLMASENEDRCTMEEFYGSKHGTDIINTYPEAMQGLIDWLFGQSKTSPDGD